MEKIFKKWKFFVGGVAGAAGKGYVWACNNQLKICHMIRGKLREAIKNLINQSPYENVDIEPIIERFTEGKDFNEQGSIRMTLVGVLHEMKKADDITFSESDLDLNTSQYREYTNSHFLIRSTDKYEKEKQQNKATHSINVGGNFVGNMNTGSVQGDLKQENSGSLTLNENQVDELRSYGVEEKDIVALKEIVKTSPNKLSFLERTIGWLGNVSASVFASGVSEHLPAIHKFINLLGTQIFQ